jgi:hypothetical protein
MALSSEGMVHLRQPRYRPFQIAHRGCTAADIERLLQQDLDRP